jgi:hypothetical protein
MSHQQHTPGCLSHVKLTIQQVIEHRMLVVTIRRHLEFLAVTNLYSSLSHQLSGSYFPGGWGGNNKAWILTFTQILCLAHHATFTGPSL